MDAFFAWSPVTMGYLHDLHESAHERFLALAISQKGEVRLIAPALSGDAGAKGGDRRM